MTLYDEDFYNLIRAGSRKSAQVIIPLLMQIPVTPPKTVLDVGCGDGTWASEWPSSVRVTGIDGHLPDVTTMSIFDGRYFKANLAMLDSFATGGPRFDMLTCLEVAEHLPPERASSFVAGLCLLSDIIVFSAAIPGQGGVGHLNEQWPQYWADLFHANGYEVTGALRYEIWNADVENWYAQNILLAVSATAELSERTDVLFLDATPYPLVHPVLYQSKLDIIHNLSIELADADGWL